MQDADGRDQFVCLLGASLPGAWAQSVDWTEVIWREPQVRYLPAISIRE